jgi:hypothetical protein
MKQNIKINKIKQKFNLLKEIQKRATIFTIVGVIVAIISLFYLIPKSDIKFDGIIYGSSIISKNNPQIGFYFRNDGNKEGKITVTISSNNENIKWIRNKAEGGVPPTNGGETIEKFYFEINKSAFNKPLGSFTIYLNYRKDTILFDYMEFCDAIGQNCYYQCQNYR